MGSKHLFGVRRLMGLFSRAGSVEQGQSVKSLDLPPPVLAMPAAKPISKLQCLFTGAAASVKNMAATMLSCLNKQGTSIVPGTIGPHAMLLTLAPVKEVFAQEPILPLPTEEHSMISTGTSKGDSSIAEDGSDTSSVNLHVSSDYVIIASANTSHVPMKHDECEDEDDDCSFDIIDDSDEDNDVNYDSDEDDDDDDDARPRNPRADWDTVEAITDIQFQKVLARFLSTAKGQDDLELGNIECVDIAKGSYHHVRIFEVKTKTHNAKYCVKVPVAGTAAFWCDVDAQVIRSEAQTMMYIHKHTKVPIPEVIGFDSTFENELGAPFTIMTAVEGRPAYELFYENVTDSMGDTIWWKPDEPDAKRKKMRRTVLTSLAQAMAQLANLKFKHTGMLTFADDDAEMESPIIVPAWHPKQPKKKGSPDALSAEQLRTEAAFVEYPVENTVVDYFGNGFAKVFPVKEDSNGFYKGRRYVMSLVLNFDPFFHDEEEDGDEYFVLHHVDLALHNIFVNDDGEVTGIIDWSNCRIVPRCIGYTSLPRPLMGDWDYKMKGLGYNLMEETHVPWLIEEYREIYADAMIAATDDGKYTLKSALYHAIDKALHDDDNNRWGCVNVVEAMLLQIPGTRFLEPMTLFGLLQDGWKGYELGYDYLKKEMRKLLAT